MAKALRRLLLQLLRVPAEPEAPEGAPESVLRFRAGANYYRWQVLLWAVACASATAGLIGFLFIVGRALRRAPEWAHTVFDGVSIFFFVVTSVVWIATYLALRLEYDLHWYILTDRSLRIRRGVWTVQELTMTFANIQEIRIASGPLQHLLGIADVEVHSAGGGGGGEGGGAHKGIRQRNVAAFAGVANANEIRERIVERLRHYRESGLGDMSHTPVAQRSPEEYPVRENDPGSLEAARLMLREAEALRRALDRPAGVA